jgi:acyl carrier protein
MWLRKTAQATRFQSRRDPQLDDDFISRCGFTPGTKAASLALTVRRVIGECGSVDPSFIHADDRWPEDLGQLDFWDSIDLLHFVFSVEDATEAKLELDDEMDCLFRRGFVVSEMTKHFVKCLLDKT